MPDFVAQFGSGDTAIIRKWSKFKVPDEKVMYGNKRGSISFARGGKDSRGNALFINLKDNPRLDTISRNGVTGFPAFGKVTRGMEVVDALYSGYGDSTMKAPFQYFLNRQLFLKSFPKLDSIQKAYILKTH